MPYHYQSGRYAPLLPAAGGLVYESTEVLLPGWLRYSRFYQGLIADLLRIMIELVGGAVVWRTRGSDHRRNWLPAGGGLDHTSLATAA